MVFLAATATLLIAASTTFIGLRDLELSEHKKRNPLNWFFFFHTLEVFNMNQWNNTSWKDKRHYLTVKWSAYALNSIKKATLLSFEKVEVNMIKFSRNFSHHCIIILERNAANLARKCSLRLKWEQFKSSI